MAEFFHRPEKFQSFWFFYFAQIQIYNPASIHCIGIVYTIIPIAKMSSRISLQQPYVVATLPRSKQAQYVVGEVYGGAPGSKKRKRSELAVGIHGEGVNLYDVRLSNDLVDTIKH